MLQTMNPKSDVPIMSRSWKLGHAVIGGIRRENGSYFMI